MAIRKALVPALLSLGMAVSGCQKEERSVPPVDAGAPEGERKIEPARPQPRLKERASEGTPLPLVSAEETSATSVFPPARIWGRADLDPENDDVVAPPEAVPDCQERLKAAGVQFVPARLPLKQIVRDIPTCGCHDAVTVTQAPLGTKLLPAAVMSCQMALAIVGLERAAQELAREHLGEEIRSLRQGGTYSCRKMARFDLVSEHSYGNAIDVFTFTLKSGKKVSVLADFGPLDAGRESLSPKAKFLRELSSTAFDQDLVSVSLSPYWDALHRDHFHFDMARYRVDGSRPH